MINQELHLGPNLSWCTLNGSKQHSDSLSQNLYIIWKLCTTEKEYLKQNENEKKQKALTNSTRKHQHSSKGNKVTQGKLRTPGHQGGA